MDHLHWEFDATPRDTLEIAVDRPANVLLLDDANYKQYALDQAHSCFGGFAEKSPVLLKPYRPGRWHGGGRRPLRRASPGVGEKRDDRQARRRRAIAVAHRGKGGVPGVSSGSRKVNRVRASAAMNYLHYEFDAGPDDVLEVQLDRGANVLLLDPGNYDRYRSGTGYRYEGGYTQERRVHLRPPCEGHWHVVIDLGGYPGTVRASVQKRSSQPTGA
jgi:hypothetical protein